MILSVTLNPCVDHALFLDRIRLNDTNRVLRTERDAGGKGVNLSRVVAELGGKTVATGFLGGNTGGFVRLVLDKQGLYHDYVEVDGETRTNFSVEDGTGSPPTTFNESGPTISSEKFDELLGKCRELGQGATWMALGGSLPPGLPADAFRRIQDEFCQGEVRSVVDADGEPMQEALKGCPDLIKPNAREASRLLGSEISNVSDARAAASELYRRLLLRDPSRPKIAVISLGALGAVMACGQGVYQGVSPAVHVRSTIGSGDSLIAGMLWGLDQGFSPEVAFGWGIAAGAATAATNGAEIARRQMILELHELVEVRKVNSST